MKVIFECHDNLVNAMILCVCFLLFCMAYASWYLMKGYMISCDSHA